MKTDLVRDFDYSGPVLDVTCGTGNVWQSASRSQCFHRADRNRAPKKMLEADAVKKYYAAVKIGSMQELVMSAGEFDCIICFGALHFLTATHFNAVLPQMFMLTRKSVMLEIDKIDAQPWNGVAPELGSYWSSQGL
ncbi:hypothetical protein BT96DRAFT_55744 [Gymnopus androsaceus JB14]|uniref:Methyltransferase domain-containing protein n=1 Tax=Gymnopus androsaceus JB14 TaxID=1447944 RepID=A0A6A4IGP3_9AGAR|nr:hypothetical protein BT96DRAFT_55744 [Gymnopus androsaceus JB14]